MKVGTFPAILVTYTASALLHVRNIVKHTALQLNCFRGKAFTSGTLASSSAKEVAGGFRVSVVQWRASHVMVWSDQLHRCHKHWCFYPWSLQETRHHLLTLHLTLRRCRLPNSSFCDVLAVPVKSRVLNLWVTTRTGPVAYSDAVPKPGTCTLSQRRTRYHTQYQMWYRAQTGKQQLGNSQNVKSDASVLNQTVTTRRGECVVFKRFWHVLWSFAHFKEQRADRDRTTMTEPLMIFSLESVTRIDGSPWLTDVFSCQQLFCSTSRGRSPPPVSGVIAPCFCSIQTRLTGFRSGFMNLWVILHCLWSL